MRLEGGMNAQVKIMIGMINNLFWYPKDLASQSIYWLSYDEKWEVEGQKD